MTQLGSNKAPRSLIDAPGAGMVAPHTDDGLLLDCKVVYAMLKIGSPEACQEALKHMTTMLSSRTAWCNCAPGQCQKLDVWGCREQSPLVRSAVEDLNS